MTRLPAIAGVFVLGLGLAVSPQASAQPGATPVGPPPSPSTPPPTAAPPTGAPPVAPMPVYEQHKWGIGLHAGSGELTSSVDPDTKIKLGGGGVHFRYRLTPRLSLDVSFDRLQGEYAPGVDRDGRAMTIGGLLHLTPQHAHWNLYLLGGFGGSRELVTSIDPGGAEIEIEYRQMHIHLGGGIEYRWTNLGIGAAIRLIGTARDDQYEPNAPPNGPVPAESSGGMLSLNATYYF